MSSTSSTAAPAARFRLAGTRQRITAAIAAAALAIGTVAAVTAVSGPVASAAAAPLTHTLSLNVVAARTLNSGPGFVHAGDPVTKYQFLIQRVEIGNPYDKTTNCLPPSNNGTPDPVTGQPQTFDANYPNNCQWGGTRLSNTGDPIVTQGTVDPANNIDDLAAAMATKQLDDGNYIVSIKADGYEIGGANFTVGAPADPANPSWYAKQPGITGPVTVKIQEGPLPLANVRIRIFQDSAPVDGTYEIDAEQGLAGFRGYLSDQLGDVSTDFFGNPLCTAYVHDAPDAQHPDGAIQFDADGAPIVAPILANTATAAASSRTVNAANSTIITLTGAAAPSAFVGAAVSGTGIAPGSIVTQVGSGNGATANRRVVLSVATTGVVSGTIHFDSINGQCFSDGNGDILIPNMAPGRYGITVRQPADKKDWFQTTTLEGAQDHDWWVMAGDTGYGSELTYGTELVPEVQFGFIPPKKTSDRIVPLEVDDNTGLLVPTCTGAQCATADNGGLARGSISGSLHTGCKYIGTQGSNLSNPNAIDIAVTNEMKDCGPFKTEKGVVAVSSLDYADTEVYSARTAANGDFTVSNLRAGNYMVTFFDDAMNHILSTSNVTITGATGAESAENMGTVYIQYWFAHVSGFVFQDDNGNGKRDPGEQGVIKSLLTVRERDNTPMDQFTNAVETDNNGFYDIIQGYPLTRYIILEHVDPRFTPTGYTVTPCNEKKGTTYTGGAVDIAVLPVLGLCGTIDWGVMPVAKGHTGGIAGTVTYGVTRNELDASQTATENWQPGIPNIPVHLYAEVICGSAIAADYPNGTCAADGEPMTNADGSLTHGPELADPYMSETYQQPTGCTARDKDGNLLTEQKALPVGGDPNLRCIESNMSGWGAAPSDATPGASAQTVNGNYGFGSSKLNLLDPAVLAPCTADENAAIVANQAYPDPANGDTECVPLDNSGNPLAKYAPLDGSADSPVYPEQEIKPGDYIVAVDIPKDAYGKPLYQITKEEDVNIFSGDQFLPQENFPPTTVDAGANPPAATPGTPITSGLGELVGCSGPMHTVNVTNPDFLAGGGSPFEGKQMPLCTDKVVTVNDGSTGGTNFELFTDVPLAAHFWGLTLNDLGITTDPTSINYDEAEGLPHAPTGIYDWAGNLIDTSIADPNGFYEAVVPTTDRINNPSPSGVSPNMFRLVGNDPGSVGHLNPTYDPRYRTIATNFQAWPGLWTVTDTAPTAAVATTFNGSLTNVKCVLPTGEPQIFKVDKVVTDGATTLTLTGKDFGPGGTWSSVWLGAPNDAAASPGTGQELTVNSWSDTSITVAIPASSGSFLAGPRQLTLINAARKSTASGITIHVLGAGYRPQVVEVGPGKTFNTDAAPITLGASATNGNDYVVVANATGIGVGWDVSGLGIDPGSTVTSITADTSSGNTSFRYAAGTRTLTRTSATFNANVKVGAVISSQGGGNSGIPAGATVTAVGTTTITISANTTAASGNGNPPAARSLRFTNTNGYRVNMTRAVLQDIAAGTPITFTLTRPIQLAIDSVSMTADDSGTNATLKNRASSLIVVYPKTPTTATPRGEYQENLVVYSPGVKLQGLGSGGFQADGTYVYGSIVDGQTFEQANPTGRNWLYLVNGLVGTNQVDPNIPARVTNTPTGAGDVSLPDSAVVTFLTPTSQYGGTGGTATNTGASGTSGQSTITFSGTGTINAYLGATVTGTGVGTGAVVTAINGRVVTVSVANSGAVSGTITFTSTAAPRLDGFTITGGKQDNVPTNINVVTGGQVTPYGGATARGQVVTQGGGVFINGGTNGVTISNNRIDGNSGTYAGGIRVGTPYVNGNIGAGDTAPTPRTNYTLVNQNLTIAHNAIVNSGAQNLAGGIGIFSGTPKYRVSYNDICGDYSAEYGGGLTQYGLSRQGRIDHNRIWFNQSYDEGGGIMLAGELTPSAATLTGGTGEVTIDNNKIAQNLANDDGGGIRTLNAGNWDIRIQNNEIANNLSTHEGGGIALNNTSKVTIDNNTVVGNVTSATAATSNGAPAAAGLATSGNDALFQASLPTGSPTFTRPVVFNNVFWDNRAGWFDGAAVHGLGLDTAAGALDINNWDIGSQDNSGLVPISNTDVQSCVGTTLNQDCSGSLGTNKNSNPLFNKSYMPGLHVDTRRAFFAFRQTLITDQTHSPWDTGDYAIQQTSPVRDMGVTSLTTTGVGAATYTASTTDINGTPRLGGVDSGAYEWTPPPTVPTAPNAVQVTSAASSLVVSWTAPTDGGGLTLGNYTARAWNAATGGVTVQSCSVAALTCTITGLTNGTTYYVDVTASNLLGESPASAPRVAGTPRTLPGAPTGVIVTGKALSLGVSWTAPADNGGAVISGYTATAYASDTARICTLSVFGTCLIYGANPAYTTSIGTCTTTGALTCDITGLAAGTRGYVVVTATNVVGTGPASSRTPTTPNAAALAQAGAPTGVTAVGNSSTGAITVSWATPPVDAEPVTSYTVNAYSALTGGTLIGSCTTTTAVTCDITSFTNLVRNTNMTAYIDVTAVTASIPAGVTTSPRLAATWASPYVTNVGVTPSTVTATNTGSSGTSGAFTIAFSGVAGINGAVGSTVSGTGIGAGATVTAVNGRTLTLSVANTGAVSGTITFGRRVLTASWTTFATGTVSNSQMLVYAASTGGTAIQTINTSSNPGSSLSTGGGNLTASTTGTLPASTTYYVTVKASTSGNALIPARTQVYGPESSPRTAGTTGA